MMTSGFWGISLIVAIAIAVIPAASAQHVMFDAPGLTGKKEAPPPPPPVLSLLCGHGSILVPSFAARRTTSTATRPT